MYITEQHETAGYVTVNIKKRKKDNHFLAFRAPVNHHREVMKALAKHFGMSGNDFPAE